MRAKERTPISGFRDSSGNNRGRNTIDQVLLQNSPRQNRFLSSPSGGRNDAVHMRLPAKVPRGHQSRCHYVLGMCHPERRPQPERRISHSNAVRDASLRLSMTDRRRSGTYLCTSSAVASWVRRSSAAFRRRCCER